MKKLFINATFHTMGTNPSTGLALLTENDKILEIFPSLNSPPADCEMVDLHGCHVYPGFIDTHTHSFEGGLYAQSLDLSKANSINSALELLDAYYQEGLKAQKTQLDAFRFDENTLAEKRFPTRAELDSVCPRLPLVLRRVDGHSCVVNSLAWKMFVQAEQNNPKGANYVSSEERLKGKLNDRVTHWFHGNYSERDIIDAYRQASGTALSKGITTVHTMVGDAAQSVTHYSFIKENLRMFNTEFILYPQSFNLKAALEAGAEKIGGCILADGSLGSFTAALRQPYAGKPDEYGRLYHADGFWRNFITEATKHRLQVAVHCIGDRAIKQINDIYLDLFSRAQHDLRHELIHCELTPDDLAGEIIRSGAVPVMQPTFDLYWGGENGFYQTALGKARSRKMNRFRTFLSQGIRITGGSDWYVTELDSLQGIRAAVNHHNPKEALNPVQAVEMYTVNAAWLSHDESRLGKLASGYDANFVCLDRDILTSEGLMAASIRSTYKSGNLVYSD